MKQIYFFLFAYILMPVSVLGQKVFMVEYESQADLKIFMVKYESQAGWNEPDKQHLLF